jgi:transglutaminase-like putative cysteine protease
MPFTTAMSTSALILVIVTIAVVEKYSENKLKARPLLAAVSLAWVVFIIFFAKMNQVELSRVDSDLNMSKAWVTDMKRLSIEVPEFVQNEAYYDLNNQEIISVSKRLVAESDTPREYTEKVLSYVYANVKYDWYESDQKCFDGNAPAIILSGSGQCDTQSIAVVALLREAYIPARVVGGCIVKKNSCSFMSVFDVKSKPVYRELDSVNLSGTYSRGDILSRKGGLHAYPQAMLPQNGTLAWFTLEATTGQMADTNCYDYFPEIESAINKNDICVSSNYAYALSCKDSDIVKLSGYGGPYLQ